MPKNEQDASKGAVRFAVLAGVLAAMIALMALMESGGKPRPVQTSDTPAARQ